MARHEIVIHENTGATRESAPYLGSYISKERVSIEQSAEGVGAKCGQPAIQTDAILHGAFEVIRDLESESLVRIHTDLGVVCGVMTGSLKSADAAFDPLANSVQLALLLDDEIKLCLANETPEISFDGEVTRLRVDNLMDLEVNSPMNLIHGQNPFRVAGYNMVLDDEGAGVCLVDGNGTEHEVVVEEAISKQLFRAHTAQLLPAGDYKLVVKSRAGDAEGPLQTSYRRVKYLAVAPGPALTKIRDAGKSEDGIVNFYGEDPVTVTGANLADVTCDDIVIKLVSANGNAEEHPVSTGFSATDTELVFANGLDPSELSLPDGDWLAGTLSLVVTKNGKTAELPFSYV